MDIIDFDEIENNCRIACARECIYWFMTVGNVNEAFKFNTDNMQNMFNSIYMNDLMFNLFIFQRLKLIKIDFERKGFIYHEDPTNFNVNLMNEVFWCLIYILLLC